MKKIVALVIFALIIQHANAQTSETIEKNLASVDIGFLGAWLTYERHLTGNLTLNSRLGMEGGFYGGGGDFNYAFTPTIGIEPRYYYNFNKRVNKSKKTINNSANYLSVEGKYITDAFVISNDNVNADAGLLVIPKIGMRRTIIGKLKFGVALGYGISLDKEALENQVWLDLGFGYVFW